MTAEVVVMNKEGVALAADSAVTIQGGPKIFNTANKLFMLAQGHPVGIMIYNNAHFMGVPWEIIIKAYRDKVLSDNTIFPTLASYAADFIEFVESGAKTIAKADHQRIFFALTVEMLMSQIARQIDQKAQEKLLDQADTLQEEQIKQITDAVISNHYSPWSNAQDSIAEADEDKAISGKILDTFGDIIQEKMEQFLGKLPLSEDNRRNLRELCVFLFTKDEFIPDLYSGVVIAGYGSEEVFPTCISFLIESMICDRLKYRRDNSISIDAFDPTASIAPFGQGDMVANFVEGIHPIYAELLENHLTRLLTNEYPNMLIQGIPDLTETDENKLRIALSDMGQQMLEQFWSRLQRSVSERHIVPILQTVSALPKDELANMAEALVSLTSFKRRVSMVTETVGGPVDVAVISKKDGFIWIKRKHYFDPEYNYHFFTQQRGKGGEHQ